MTSNLLKLTAVHALITFSACSKPGNESTPIELFNGTNLDGWQNFGGGKFFVEDGLIIGEAAPGFPNSFLATNELYGDFELNLEFKIVCS